MLPSLRAFKTVFPKNGSIRFYSQDVKPKVGFIGLGNMGGHMANNLLKAGYPLVVFDINTAAVDKLVANGAKKGPNPSDLAADVEVVVTMLPSTPHVREVYLGGSKVGPGVIASSRPGALFIDASTIDPTAARDVAALAAQSPSKGTLLDAPVSGGVLGAEAGTLTFMVGGPEEGFQRALPLLKSMGKNIVHCGPSGNGQVVKVCNNLVLGISMAGVSEAMNLGIKLGMDPKLLANIFNTSSARCWSSDTYNPVPGVMPNVPASRGYTGGFGVDLMAKDLGLAVAAANSIKAPLPLGGVVSQLYNMISSHGGGGKDFSSVYEFLSKKEEKK